MRRAEWLLLLLGMTWPLQAAEPAAGETPPDAELLEFLADWQEEDQTWLDAEMNDEQVGAALQDVPAQEINHD